MHICIRLRVLLCSLLLLNLFQAFSFADDHAPTVTPAPIVLPMEYVNEHLYVSLHDDKLGDLRMLVDTGWERTTIDAATAAKGEVRGSFWRRGISTKGFGGEGHNSYQTIAVKLEYGNSEVFSTKALVLDLSALSKAMRRQLDGALGWDFFRNSCVTLDYKAKQMTVRNRHHCSPPSDKHATLQGRWSSDGVSLAAVVTLNSGRSAKALLHFDSGSDNTVFLHPRFQSVLGEGPKASGTSTEGWGFNGTFRKDLVPMKSIELEGGKLRFNGGEGATISVGHPGSYSVKSDGVIGNALLEKATWTFDPAAKRIYVTNGF